jgi:hypothetical protein
MVLADWLFSRLYLLALLPFVHSTDITDIQGPAFRSPLEGQTVHNVTGVVTAKACNESSSYTTQLT